MKSISYSRISSSTTSPVKRDDWVWPVHIHSFPAPVIILWQQDVIHFCWNRYSMTRNFAIQNLFLYMAEAHFQSIQVPCYGSPMCMQIFLCLHNYGHLINWLLVLRDWLSQFPEKILFGTDAVAFGPGLGWEMSAWIASDYRKAGTHHRTFRNDQK